MTRFIIEKDGVYYLTSGKLLTYDEKAAKDEKQKEGVKKLKKEFERIHDLPHTWYHAVELKDSSFSPINTGEKL